MESWGPRGEYGVPHTVATQISFYPQDLIEQWRLQTTEEVVHTGCQPRSTYSGSLRTAVPPHGPDSAAPGTAGSRLWGWTSTAESPAGKHWSQRAALPAPGVSRRGDSTLCHLPVPTEKESWLGNPGRRAAHLPVGCWDKTQEFIDVTHEKPVREESHRGLHLLGTQEVLQGLMHVAALAAVLTGRSYDSHQHHQEIHKWS